MAFMWIKNLNKIKELVNFYGNSDSRIRSARQKFGIDIISLETGDHPKLVNGYKYLVTCSQGHKRMMDFFREGGIYIYDTRHDIKSHFLILNPVEQYFIHTGKRLFKGFEEYDDIHKFVFDLETTGLDPEINRIFLIGIYTNKGDKQIIPIEDNDDSEREAITKFFEVINQIKPTIIAGYNSANFDWDFFFVRCKKLGINIQDIAITLKPGELINTKPSMLKLGNEVEDYTQVNMFGYSIIDIIHSARRAQAIDSSMKSVGLKYVCQYNKIAKKNRVYIVGDKIGNTWYSKDKFYFDDRTGSYCKTKPALEFMDYIRREDIQANPDKIYWYLLPSNPSAIHLLEANPDKIDWFNLALNPGAIHILETNLDKIDWSWLSENPNAIHLLEANPNEIVSIPGLRNRAPKEISIRNLASIIQARMEEIIEIVQNEIIQSGYYKKLAGGIVLTGGGS